MFQYKFLQWLIFFYLYCFFGWCFESTYVSICQRKLTNRGFLRGPMLPIYGTGAIAILYATLPVRCNAVLVYVLGLIAATALEYVTGVVMESLFKVRYWDYSKHKFNLNGHICLSSSIAWGFLSVLLVYVIHEPLEQLVFYLGDRIVTDFAFAISCAFLNDVVVSVRGAFNLRKLLEENERIRQEAQQLAERVEAVRSEMSAVRDEVLVQAESRVADVRSHAAETISDLRERLTHLGSAAISNLPEEVQAELRTARDVTAARLDTWYAAASRDAAALIANHPTIHSEHYAEALASIKSAMRPDEAAIEQQEQEENRFAQGTNFYKVFWIYFIAAILGCVIETVFCIVTRGHFEYRVGSVFAPISPVYGLGAIALTLGLYSERFKRGPIIFFSGIFVGTVVEYACSFVQEAVLGSTSWDYHGYPLNINGRVCLLYSVFWGILALAWIKTLFPMMNLFILRHIPQKIGKPLTILLFFLVLADSFVTLTAIVRWADRQAEHVPYPTKLEAFCDEYLPDERMAELFPNMVFATEAEAQTE